RWLRARLRSRLQGKKGVPSWSTLTKGTSTTRASGFGCRITHCLVPALEVPLSISSGWRKRKHATTTDDNGYWRWRAFIVPSPGSFPPCPRSIKIKVGPSVSRAERWHARAEECRTLADCFTDPTCREQLRQLAQSYDCMAVAAE